MNFDYVEEAHALEGWEKDVEFYGKWISPQLTLYLERETDRVVGFFVHLSKDIKVEQEPRELTAEDITALKKIFKDSPFNYEEDE